MELLTPGIRAALIPALEAALRDRPVETVDAMLAAFRVDFSPERLAALEGEALLDHMHARGKASLAYWLERINDPARMVTRWFGSIAGGSALKFVVYQSSDDLWYTGHPTSQRAVSRGEAADIATAQRDELLAVHAIVSALPSDPGDPTWEGLSDRIADAAPEHGHLAFFHKIIALWHPDKIDDYHSARHQANALVWCGLDVDGRGLWANARAFCHLRRSMEVTLGRAVPMSTLGHAMNQLAGTPADVWRIGAGHEGYDAAADMRRDGVVSIGWSELGDLQLLVGERKGHDARRVIREAIQEQWPQSTHPMMTPQQAGRDAAQLYRFLRKLQAGDLVAVALGMEVRLVGRIVGDYMHVEGATYAHQRRVEWLRTEPFTTRSKKGLMTTVKWLTEAYRYRADIARHLAEPGQAGAGPTPKSGPATSATVREIIGQLDRKGQVLLLGPPGTGKTFHAMQAAEELVAQGTHGRSWARLRGDQRAALVRPGPGQRVWTCTFHPAYGYEDFVEGLFPVPTPGGLSFEPRPGLFRRICAVAEETGEPVVLVVDEFNRGDAARIFGELLTLLELDKRGRVTVTLPHSRAPFTVPSKVRLIATMNTSDRSIALLDAALQRRFGKVELLPDPDVLGEVAVGGISLRGLLVALNRNLLRVLGDRARDLQVGHAYLMRDGRPIESIGGLREVVRYDLLPLLQDYCADDPAALVELVGERLYCTEQRRFRSAHLAAGAEDLLVEVLLEWGEGVAAASLSDESGDDEDEAQDDESE
jgi:5-methylcytosine-specific restriction protein B